MIKLYLARHGETEGNVQQWYQGSTDVPLNEHGLEQPGAWVNFSAMSISMPSTAARSSAPR